MSEPARKHTEESIASLLSELREPPRGWIDAAKELPRARQELDDIVARAQADASYRKRVLDDLESALREAGHAPEPALVAALKAGVDA